MRVGIVGAGIAGLAAARRLAQAGREVVVFEKSEGLGGRVATRRMGPYVIDTGATSIAPRGRRLEDVMLRELDTSDLVPVALPIYIHRFGRIGPGDVTKAKIERYTFRSGNTMLAKLLAAGLDVRKGVKVEGLKRSGATYELEGEGYDAVILACPLPQAQALLESMGETRRFSGAKYRPCLSILLGFDKPLAPVTYHAIIDPEQRHPLTWLSLESMKAPGRAPEGHTAMVAQMSPAYSREHYEAGEEKLIRDTVEYVSRLYGVSFAQPVQAQVKRWRYSQPETTAQFENVNQPGSTLLVASDGLLGGRVELAFEVGVKTAEMLI